MQRTSVTEHFHHRSLSCKVRSDAEGSGCPSEGLEFQGLKRKRFRLVKRLALGDGPWRHVHHWRRRRRGSHAGQEDAQSFNHCLHTTPAVSLVLAALVVSIQCGLFNRWTLFCYCECCTKVSRAQDGPMSANDASSPLADVHQAHGKWDLQPMAVICKLVEKCKARASPTRPLQRPQTARLTEAPYGAVGSHLSRSLPLSSSRDPPTSTSETSPACSTVHSLSGGTAC